MIFVTTFHPCFLFVFPPSVMNDGGRERRGGREGLGSVMSANQSASQVTPHQGRGAAQIENDG